MALAPESAAAHPTSPLAALLEAALAGIAAAAPFESAAIAILEGASIRSYVAAPAGVDTEAVARPAIERLRSLRPDLDAATASPTLLQVPLAATASTGEAVQSATLYREMRPVGVIRLIRSQEPSFPGSAALFTVAQALTRAFDRGLPFDNAGPSPAPFQAAPLIALADSMGEGLIEVDADGRARPLNGAGERLLEVIGGAPGEIAPAPVLDAVASANATEQTALREVVAQSPGARHIALAAIVRGESRLVALRDHTEEKLLQERLLQSEKMASVGQLVSGVAHELNNPLTGVMGFAQLLLARELDETVRSQVQTIYGEAERAAKIVQNLLSFARRRKPSKEMADVNALLQRVLELRSYDFTVRNISLDMTLDTRLPRVLVDPDQIQQVFFNVIKNAEQAMIDAHGGGKLTVTTSASPEGVRIAISDDGPGIPAEVQRRIFDPFFTTKEAGQGTGLGLTICYGIIDEHGGRIWAENAPAGGAVFIIELPLARAEAGTVSHTGPVSSQAAPTVRGQRVLVVDDEESIRLLLQDILQMDSHYVETAASGLQALERLDQGEFDIVITDMKMPQMDGASFYREVQARRPDLARRIIFITGDTVSPDTRAFLQQVANPVLAKPFKIGPLREAMESVLS
jgi:signal transduction histidine kinase